jgi:hypothetical protein
LLRELLYGRFAGYLAPRDQREGVAIIGKISFWAFPASFF